MIRPLFARRGLVVAALVVLACLSVNEDGASASHRGPHPHATIETPLGVEQRIEDPTGHALDSFHGALRRAERGAGQARVIWWGASHTAPDLYVGNLRRSLQQRFGDAGAGFVSPVRPFPAYDSSTARIAWGGAWRTLRGDRGQDGYYGFAGFAVESLTAGSWGSLDTHGGRWGERPVGAYDVSFLRQPNGGRFEVRIDDHAAAVVDTHGELGDGHAHFRVVDGPHRIEVRAIDDAPVQIFGIAMERETPGVLVDTVGIPGSRARAHLRWDDASYRTEIRRRRPDLVVLAYGTNESEDTNVPLRRYEADLTRVVHRIRQTVPGSSCLLVGPTDRPIHAADGSWQPRPLTESVIEVQRQVALQEGCGFFDMQAFMGGPMSMMEWVAHSPPFGQPDHIHLTAAGHARLAEVMERALLERF